MGNNSRYPLPETAQVITITPQMATDWLTHRAFDGNRKINERDAIDMAKAMLRPGGWPQSPTHEGLSFDEEGLVLDGQHRLRAVELSKKPLTTWVFPDMDRENFKYMNIGRKRTAADFVHLPFSRTVVAATRYIHPVLVHAPTREYVANNLSMPQKLALVDAWEHELGFWGPKIINPARKSHVPYAPLLAQVAIAHRVGGQPVTFHIQGFLNGLETGASLEADNPALVLRERFKDAHAYVPNKMPAAPLKGTVEARMRAWVYLTKTFTAWMDDKSIPRLIWVPRRGDNEGLVPPVWGADRLREMEAGS